MLTASHAFTWGAQKERWGKVIFSILITWFSRSCTSLFEHSGLEQKLPYLSRDLQVICTVQQSREGKSKVKKLNLKAFHRDKTEEYFSTVKD